MSLFVDSNQQKRPFGGREGLVFSKFGFLKQCIYKNLNTIFVAGDRVGEQACSVWWPLAVALAQPCSTNKQNTFFGHTCGR